MSDHSRRYTTAHWDHERDLRKHDFPLRLEPAPSKLSTALDIALIVRGLKNLQEGAALIEQYAQMVAAIALADAAEREVMRLNLAIESPLARKEPV